MTSDLLRPLIRAIPDFPAPGIIFRDITPLLLDPAGRDLALSLMEAVARDARPTLIAGVESRGFIFAVPLAERLGCGFVPIRKPGKLPADVLEESYTLEYGEGRLQMHADALRSTDRVLIVDDVLATGGTAAAAVRLAQRGGASVAGLLFLIELAGLAGRRQLRDAAVHSVLTY